MINSIHYSICPVCSSADLIDLFNVKDNSISKKDFLLIECSKCRLRITQDVPAKDEIGAYYKSDNYISHTNTSQSLVSRLYKLARNITLRQKRKLIQQQTSLQTGNLLDVGAGTGFFSAAMKQAGWQVKGLEPDADAKRMALDLNNIELADMEELYALNADSYDAITLWHVLEHVHDLNAYVNQFAQLLKKNGKLFIAVPNYTSYDADAYKEFWAAYDVPRHLYHFSPGSIRVLMEKHGLQVSKIKPMWFDSFYVSILSSKYKNGRTNWFGAAFVSKISNIKAFLHRDKCSSLIYIISKKD